MTLKRMCIDTKYIFTCQTFQSLYLTCHDFEKNVYRYKIYIYLPVFEKDWYLTCHDFEKNVYRYKIYILLAMTLKNMCIDTKYVLTMNFQTIQKKYITCHGFEKNVYRYKICTYHEFANDTKKIFTYPGFEKNVLSI